MKCLIKTSGGGRSILNIYFIYPVIGVNYGWLYIVVGFDVCNVAKTFIARDSLIYLSGIGSSF